MEEATASIAQEGRIDAAVLNVNLRGALVPVADGLRERGIPFAFATGYDRWALLDRFADAPRVKKPLQARNIAEMLAPLLAG